MIGAIAGDIIGSIHEGAGTKTKRFPLFSPYVRFTDDIWQVAGELLDQALTDRHSGVRLLGMGISRFADDELIQQMLFDDEDRENQRRLDTVADEVCKKFRF